MKWLVTAFEPFNGAMTNSSEIILARVSKMPWGTDLKFLSGVPVSFVHAWKSVHEAIESNPDIEGVLCLGQAETRKKVSLERIALNWADASIADNLGLKAENQPLVHNTAQLHWSQIPWDKMKIPQNCEKSYSAGTFVCNALMFQGLEWAEKNQRQFGFVHIPALKSQNISGPLALDMMSDEEASVIVIEVLQFLISLRAEDLRSPSNFAESLRPLVPR